MGDVALGLAVSMANNCLCFPMEWKEHVLISGVMLLSGQ